jgi:hypothetical protein
MSRVESQDSAPGAQSIPPSGVSHLTAHSTCSPYDGGCRRDAVVVLCGVARPPVPPARSLLSTTTPRKWTGFARSKTGQGFEIEQPMYFSSTGMHRRHRIEFSRSRQPTIAEGFLSFMCPRHVRLCAPTRCVFPLFVKLDWCSVYLSQPRHGRKLLCMYLLTQHLRLLHPPPSHRRPASSWRRTFC